MRLINTETLKLEEISDKGIPPYAILSHTWGNASEELTIFDVESGNINKPGVGSIKFQGCCQQAKSDNIGYVWIDTCCIDKTNLAELSEAINSMFRWYSGAAVCYAYLSDVPDGDKPSQDGSKFQTSRWFERGWTLQELLAPKHIRFYNSKWHNIGTKGSRCTVIRKITNVPRQFLLGIAELHTASVAQRMSWAAQRETARAEDLAYCLLGIFGITMPMIYGEGGKEAFFRLQEQIMKTTRDDSILAWGLDSEKKEPPTTNPGQVVDGEILAANPSAFADSGQIVTREQVTNPLHSLDIFGGSLRVYLPLITTPAGETFGLLSCGPGSNEEQAVAIPLAKINSAVANEYVRPRGCPSVLQPVDASDSLPELIHIKRDGQRNISLKNQRYLFYDEDLFAEIGLTLIDVTPQSCWKKQQALISPTSDSNNATAPILIRVRHSKEGSQDFVIILEFQHTDSGINPHCSIVVCHRETPLEEIAKKCQYMTLEAFGGKSASNGSLHLCVVFEPIEGMMIHIKPQVDNFPPDYTINANTILENLSLLLETTRLLRERMEAGAEIAERRQGAENSKHRLNQIKKEKEIIKGKFKKLEEEKEMLNEEENLKIQETQSFGDWQVEARERQHDIYKQLAYSQKRLDEFHRLKGLWDGWTPFRWAVERCDPELMTLLLEEGVDTMAVDKPGYVRVLPLATASMKGDVDAVRLLLATPGVDPDSKNNKLGWTPLTWASSSGHEAIVRLLLDTGKVDINSRDIYNRTPLYWASERGYPNVIQLLLDKGAGLDCVHTFNGHLEEVDAVAFSHNSRLVVSGSSDETIKLWDVATGQCQKTLLGHTGFIWSVALSHDSKLVVSGSYDRTIKLWDVATGQCQQTLLGHGRSVNSVAFSHDSKLVVSGSDDRTIKLWDVATGQCQQTLQGHGRSVNSVAFSHDSKLVASGSYDKTVKLWDVATGQCQQTLQGHKKSVISAAFSNDSKLVVSGSDDRTIKLWDVATGQRQQTLQGHKKSVISVAFSHDSKSIVSASSETMKLWDVATGQLQQMLNSFDKNVNSVAFSHDSRLVVSGLSNGAVKLWDISVVHNLVPSLWYQDRVKAEEEETASSQ